MFVGGLAGVAKLRARPSSSPKGANGVSTNWWGHCKSNLFWQIGEKGTQAIYYFWGPAAFGKGQMGSALMGSLQHLMFLTEGLRCLHYFGVPPLTYLCILRSARACLFPQSVKTHCFCSGPISVDPICPQPSSFGGACGRFRTHDSRTPNLPTKIIPTKIRGLKTSGKLPMDMWIPPPKIKILLESNPLKSRILVLRLAVPEIPEHYS